MIMNKILIENGFVKTRTVKYTTEYIKDTTIIYVVNEQYLSVVISPYSSKRIIDKYSGYLYHNSSLREFPKRLNKGENEIHYGFKINFTCEEEFNNFIKEIN